MRTPTLYREGPDGDLEEVALPCRWTICRSCDGHGKSSRYLGAITQDDRLPGGSWEDPDDFAEYMRGGYDRTCDECGGSGKVREVDVDRLSAEDRAAWLEQVRDEREYERECEMERRYGC